MASPFEDLRKGPAGPRHFRFYSYQQPARLTDFQAPQKLVWPGLSVQVGHPHCDRAGLPAQ
jgi:hypothetical protein